MMRSRAAMAGWVGLMMLGVSATCGAQGAAQFGFGVMGGTTTPAGSLSSVAESGWHTGASLRTPCSTGFDTGGTTS